MSSRETRRAVQREHMKRQKEKLRQLKSKYNIDDKIEWVSPDGKTYCSIIDAVCKSATNDFYEISYIISHWRFSWLPPFLYREGFEIKEEWVSSKMQRLSPF